MSYWKKIVLQLSQRQKIEELIMQFRQECHADLQVAIVRKASQYKLAQLRFANLGILLTSIIVLVIRPEFGDESETKIILLQTLAFCFGLGLGKLAPFKKISLTKDEINREVSLHARDLFNSYGLQHLPSQAGMLLIYYYFEKKLVLVIDDHMKSKIRRADLNKIMELINNHSMDKNCYAPLTEAIATIKEKILHFYPQGVAPQNKSELSTHILWPDLQKIVN